MRAAFERLTCRVKHKWGSWDAEDKDNIHRYCLRASCDAVQKVTELEFLRIQFYAAQLLRQIDSFSKTRSSGGRIKWRRYASLQEKTED